MNEKPSQPTRVRCASRFTAPARRSLRIAALIVVAATALTACGGGGEVSIGSGQGADPVVLDFPVFYVKRPVPDPMAAPSDARDLRTFDIGADLYMRDR